MGRQMVKGKAVDAIVAWTNEKAGARSFSTTIGHNTDTVADARYLDLITRGLLWACDKLTPDYLTPFKGQNKVTFVPAKPAEAPKPPPTPKDATGIKTTASSTQPGNDAWKAVDGDENTRWCASGANMPERLELEFEKPQDLTGLEIVWERKDKSYQHKIEIDGKMVADISIAKSHVLEAKQAKKIVITCTGNDHGGWASIREVKLKGPGIKAIAPKLSAEQKKEYDKANDPRAKEGNITPKIVKLTPEEEAAILKDVKVAEGFEVTLFANSAAANYPVFVAAEPDGTLYVSSDGNGSLGRNPKRGRVIRLRDLDGDGRADETKIFCEVDSPRGLVWDHDRLYLVHPPHLSEFIDADHDGVAEKQNILVKDIAFGFKDRPADHTTNGLSLGIDGWLYIAGGDFGFMKATGTDGKTLQHRGGGVIRVRPDGTGLEIYSTGTRNILEVAISPLMDIFARDNTNDGGGWNVRFHHFTGLDDHGYPRLYKNFNDEAIQPLADYGGGSGCGAVYIDEPGFGTWNNAPFTCDWGSGALWHHQVKPKGATFEETRKPEPFIKMTRPTDADVDGMSRVYCASWKGATFDWAGPDVGYIVQVKPKGFKAEPMPDLAKAKDEELVKVLESASNRRRMEAQRELVRRRLTKRELKVDDEYALSRIIGANAQDKNFVPSKAAPSAKAAVIFAKALTNNGRFVHTFEGLSGKDPAVSDIYWRATLAHSRPVTEQFDIFEGESLLAWPKPGEASAKARVAMAQAFSVGAFSPILVSHGEQINSLVSDALNDDDVAHQVIHGLRVAALNFEGKKGRYVMWDDQQPPHEFAILAALFYATDFSKNLKISQRALMVLRGVHTTEVVTGLIERLGKATDPALRQGILAALCRLHFKEGEWKGDSWGTRPDTRGPYYQPEAWSETPKIAVALKDALAKATPEEAAFLVKELNRNRIQFNEAQQRILELAKKDPKVLPELAAQMAGAEEIPAEAVPLLVGLVRQVGPVGPVALSQAIIALSKTDSADGVSATLAALEPLKKLPDSGKDYDAAFNRLLERAEARKPPSARRADRREGRVAGVDVCECRVAEPREPQNGQPRVHPAHAEGARQGLGRSEAPQAHHRRHQRLQAHAQRRQSARRAR
jgi:putative membrane-bound dehydrogenase-like protein